FAHESVHELADTIARGCATQDMAFVRHYLPDLMNVSADDVKRVTKKYLVDRKPVVIESIPKADAGVGAGSKKGLNREATKNNGASFDLKAAKTVVLENGLKLILLENHRLPIVVAEAQVGKVRLYEPPDQIGIATLMGMLLEEGTKSRTGPEIARAIEDTGGALKISAPGGGAQGRARRTRHPRDGVSAPPAR